MKEGKEGEEGKERGECGGLSFRINRRFSGRVAP